MRRAESFTAEGAKVRQGTQQKDPSMSMVVAGVMSGTSADGVDVAVCRIRAGADGEPRIRLLGYEGFRYTRAVRERVLAAMDAKAISVAEVSRLSWRLGAIYGECVAKACAGLGVELGAVALSRGAHLSRDETASKMAGAALLGQAVAESAVVGSMMVRTSETWLAGKPLISACL